MSNKNENGKRTLAEVFALEAKSGCPACGTHIKLGETCPKCWPESLVKPPVPLMTPPGQSHLEESVCRWCKTAKKIGSVCGACVSYGFGPGFSTTEMAKEVANETIKRFSPGATEHVNQSTFRTAWEPAPNTSTGDAKAVNHPQHYNVGKIEVYDAIREWQLGFEDGNVVKYTARAKHKGKELEDLRKAKWYLDRLIENLEAKAKA